MMPASINEVLRVVMGDCKVIFGVIMGTFVCQKLMETMGILERFSGKGGHMGNGPSNKKDANGQYTEVTNLDNDSDDESKPTFNNVEMSTSKNRRVMMLSNGYATGIMSPIEEEPNGLISDSSSTISTNSRNFQMPEKDLI